MTGNFVFLDQTFTYADIYNWWVNTEYDINRCVVMVGFWPTAESRPVMKPQRWIEVDIPRSVWEPNLGGNLLPILTDYVKSLPQFGG